MLHEKKTEKEKRIHYIRSIFTGYERMLEDPELEQLTFTYLNEETQLTRDEHQRIHFTTRDLPSK